MRLFLTALALLAGCARTSHKPVLETARAAQEANSNAGLSSEPNLVGIARVETGLGFEVAARAPRIDRFPCGRCHDRPVEQMKRGPKAAHWEVSVRHAPEGVMSCDSCHATRGDTDTLRSLRGEPIAFNHSYKLCAQCHSRQAKDWAGGAHGKRLGGWAPPRVVEACTGCHNPHSPAFQTRWPATGGHRHE